MEEKDIIKMNIKELKRLTVISKVLDKRMIQTEAAATLSLSDRQIRRIVKKVRKEGEIGIIHKSRGKPSNRILSPKIKESALKFYKKKYKDFGPTLAAEKLEELDSVCVNRETLRGWLIETGLWKKKRKSREHRRWRERKEYFGQMALLDGSHHDWLEGRGEELVLMGYIDDATGICHGKFYDYEGTLPALDSLKEYIKKYGIPLSVYLDKHSTYLINRKLTIEEELQGVKKPLTQFERACKELGVKVIHADSPQAKGRIERLFGVLQDRLVKEMRLANICAKDEANNFLVSYLPKHNQRFSVIPAKKDDLHVPVPAHINLEQILCIKKQRQLRNDNTISFNGSLYLIEDKLTTKTITVEERPDRQIYLSLKGKYLNYKQVEARPKINSTNSVIQQIRNSYIPPINHPWRNSLINHKKQINKKEECCLSLSFK